MIRIRFRWYEYGLGCFCLLLGLLFVRYRENIHDYIHYFPFVLFFCVVSDIQCFLRLIPELSLRSIISIIIGTADLAFAIFLTISSRSTNGIVLIFTFWFAAQNLLWIIFMNFDRYMNRGYCIVLGILNAVGIVLGILMLFNSWLSVLFMGSYIGTFLMVLGGARILLHYDQVIEYERPEK